MLGEDRLCDDAPDAHVDVCGNGVAENVSGDCDDHPAGIVKLQVSGVDDHGVGESGQSGSWENGVGHGDGHGGV